jgi:hypothetical protein
VPPPSSKDVLAHIMERRGVTPERVVLMRDHIEPNADPPRVAEFLRGIGVERELAADIAREYGERPTAKDVLAAIMMKYGVPKDVINRTFVRLEPPSDELELATFLTRRSGLSRDSVEQILKEYRAQHVPVMLTVVAAEEEPEQEEWEENVEHELEAGLSSEQFWITPITTVREAIKAAIEAADAHYFRFTFERDEDSTEVWAMWADEWETHGHEYGHGVHLDDLPYSSMDESLIDVLIKRLERIPTRPLTEEELEGTLVTLL